MDSLAGHNRGLSTRRTAPARWRIRDLFRVVLALALVTCAAAGAWLYVSPPGPKSQDAPTIEGIWELKLINGELPGDSASSGIVSQRVALRAGKVRGETVVRTNPDVPAAALPFPDESVDRVVTNADETGYRVLWSGTYDNDDRNQVTLRIGKAVYFVKASIRADREAIDFNQDIILTVHGAAHYRRAHSSRSQ